MNDKEFLIWLHYRLTEVHGEKPNFDYMWKLRSIINSMSDDQLTPNTCSKSIQEIEKQ